VAECPFRFRPVSGRRRPSPSRRNHVGHRPGAAVARNADGDLAGHCAFSLMVRRQIVAYPMRNRYAVQGCHNRPRKDELAALRVASAEPAPCSHERRRRRYGTAPQRVVHASFTPIGRRGSPPDWRDDAKGHEAVPSATVPLSLPDALSQCNAPNVS
jgi:hypothetical protein